MQTRFGGSLDLARPNQWSQIFYSRKFFMPDIAILSLSTVLCHWVERLPYDRWRHLNCFNFILGVKIQVFDARKRFWKVATIRTRDRGSLLSGTDECQVWANLCWRHDLCDRCQNNSWRGYPLGLLNWSGLGKLRLCICCRDYVSSCSRNKRDSSCPLLAAKTGFILHLQSDATSVGSLELVLRYWVDALY